MRFDLLNKSGPAFSAASDTTPAVARFDIGEIAWSLQQTQQQFKQINQSLNVRRSQLTSEAVANMVEGYRFVDQLLAQSADLMARGNSSLLFEINTLVLYGAEQKNRDDFALAIERNKEHFYDDQHGGIGSLMQWNDFHANDDIWRKAAGLYIQVLSRPQLFFEGNHRSAILIVSFLLGRKGYPPFVLTPANAKPLLDQSKRLSDLWKNSLSALIQLPPLRKQLASTFKETLRPRHRL